MHAYYRGIAGFLALGQKSAGYGFQRWVTCPRTSFPCTTARQGLSRPREETGGHLPPFISRDNGCFDGPLILRPGRRVKNPGPWGAVRSAAPETSHRDGRTADPIISRRAAIRSLRRRSGLPNRSPDVVEMFERGLPQNTCGRCVNPLRQLAGNHEDYHGSIFNFTRLPVAM